MENFQALLSSSAVPVSAGDKLVVELTPRFGFQPIVTVRTIAQDAKGNLIPAATTQTLLADGTTQKLELNQATGVLFYMSVDCQQTGVEGGELFATAYIQQGSVVGQENNLYLGSGYVATGSPLIYPAQTSGNINSQWSPTIRETFPDTNAGDPLSVVLNSNKQSKLTGFRFTFFAGATSPGTRLIVTLESDGGPRYRQRQDLSMAALSTCDYFGVLGVTPPADNLSANAAYFIIPAELSGLLVTVNVEQTARDAGDLFTSIAAFYYSQTSF